MQGIRRYFHGENRERSVAMIREIVRTAIGYIREIHVRNECSPMQPEFHNDSASRRFMNRSLKGVSDCKEGILNLCKTYATDTYIIAMLESTIEEIDDIINERKSAT